MQQAITGQEIIWEQEGLATGKKDLPLHGLPSTLFWQKLFLVEFAYSPAGQIPPCEGVSFFTRCRS